MRLQKGSKVEVLTQKGAPSGSWRCAEVICGNGHTYTVRYNGSTGTAGKITLERVSRKAIRPCPPVPEVAENWFPGDVVEVFDDFSWKMATISRLLGKKDFLVRLLGSSLEFKVGRSLIRSRQSWQEGKWMVIGQGSSSPEDRKHDKKLNPKCNVKSLGQSTRTKLSIRLKDECFTLTNMEKVQDPHIASCRTLKRGFCVYSKVEAYDNASQKYQAIERDGRLQRVIAANPSPSPERVDAFDFPREVLAEKFTHSSLYNRTGISEMDADRRKPTAPVEHAFSVNIDYDDADRVSCSVGSCSIASNNCVVFQHNSRYIEDVEGHSSDAESFCCREYDGGNSLPPTKEELAAEIHRLELHAYRCTMEALYASGPLSWEQEVLVTNLRLSLHISNDEHLMEGQSRRLVALYTSLPNVER